MPAVVAPPQKQRQQPAPSPGAPPPSPVANGMPGQAAPNVVQQGPPPTPAPPQTPGAAQLPGAEQMGDMNNLPQAPGQVSSPGTKPEDARGVNPAPAPAAGATEPFGAQVLRRMHEDHSLLMQDYDQMMALVENPALQQFLFDSLTGIDSLLTAIENLFQQHYGHLSPLQGAMPADPNAVQSGAAPSVQSPAAPGQVPPGDNAPPIPGESEGTGEASGEEGPPPDEESEEGEENKPTKKKGKEEKALRVGEEKKDKDVQDASSDALPANSGKAVAPRLPKKAATCPKCGKVECSCKNRHRAGEKSMCPECKCTPCGCGIKLLTCTACGANPCCCGTKSLCPKCSNSPCSCTTNTPAPAMATKDHGSESLLSSALLSHELKWAKESHDFLNDLSCCQDFGDEHRMKSYAFHKMLGEISGMGSTPAAAAPVMGKSSEKGMQAAEEQMAADGVMMPSSEKSLHPHRLKCMGACKFFKGLSTERAYGDRHRDMAKFHYDAMEELFSAVEEKLEEKIDEELADGGEDGDEALPDEAAVIGEPRSKEDELEDDDGDDFTKALEEAQEQQKAMDLLLKDLSSFAVA